MFRNVIFDNLVIFLDFLQLLIGDNLTVAINNWPPNSLILLPPKDGCLCLLYSNLGESRDCFSQQNMAEVMLSSFWG